MRYKLSPEDIVYAHLTAQEGVLLSLRTKNYYRLNETAQEIWQALSAGKNQEEIATLLCEQYEVEYGSALEDVRQLLSLMKAEEILE